MSASFRSQNAWVRSLSALSLLGALLLSGCATVDDPDPLERVNRKTFALNEGLDRAIFKPAATGWKAITPALLRRGVDNFFSNAKDLWSAVNLTLQGHPGLGLQAVARFSFNTLFGLGGVLDPATEMHMPRQNQDLGLTLAHWGLPPGAYVVWPILGPSTVRDSLNLPFALYISPEMLSKNAAARNIAVALRFTNDRAQILDATQTIDEVALDKYLFIRDAYLQRRQSQVEQDYETGWQADPWWSWPQDQLALKTGSPASAVVALAGLAPRSEPSSGPVHSDSVVAQPEPSPMQVSADESSALSAQD